MKGVVLALLCLLIVRVIAQNRIRQKLRPRAQQLQQKSLHWRRPQSYPRPQPSLMSQTRQMRPLNHPPPTTQRPPKFHPQKRRRPAQHPLIQAPPPTDNPTEPTPPAEPTATAADSPTLTSIAPTSFETTFEGGMIPVDWQFTGLWTVVQTESGHALQADLNGGTLSFAALPYPFYVEVDLWLQTGSITIQTDENHPLVTLTPQTLSLASCALEEATVSLTGWHTLRVVWMEQGISTSIDGTTLNQPCDLTSDPDEIVQLIVNAGLLRIRRVQLAAGSPAFPTLQVEPAPPSTAIPPSRNPQPLCPPIVSSAAQPLSASALPAPILTYPPNGTLIGGNVEMPLWLAMSSSTGQCPLAAAPHRTCLSFPVIPPFKRSPRSSRCRCSPTPRST